MEWLNEFLTIVYTYNVQNIDRVASDLRVMSLSVSFFTWGPSMMVFHFLFWRGFA